MSLPQVVSVSGAGGNTKNPPGPLALLVDGLPPNRRGFDDVPQVRQLDQLQLWARPVDRESAQRRPTQQLTPGDSRVARSHAELHVPPFQQCLARRVHRIVLWGCRLTRPAWAK